MTDTAAPAWTRIVAIAFKFGPLLFGLLFLAPAVSQILPLLGWDAPFGLSPLGFGLILGGAWGGYATWRGSWLTWTL